MIGPGGLAGAGEQLADALEQRQQGGVGGKADDQALLGQPSQVGHHLLGGRLGVMDEHIQTDHGVIAAGQAFQVGGLKVQPLFTDAGLQGAPRRLGHHGGGEIAGGHGGAQLGQGQGQAANPTAGVTDGDARQIALLAHPGQHGINGFLMPDADVALDLVDLVTVAVDAVPALETLGFKIGLHLCLLGRLAVARGLGNGGHGRLRGHGR